MPGVVCEESEHGYVTRRAIFDQVSCPSYWNPAEIRSFGVKEQVLWTGSGWTADFILYGDGTRLTDSKKNKVLRFNLPKQIRVTKEGRTGSRSVISMNPANAFALHWLVILFLTMMAK